MIVPIVAAMLQASSAGAIQEVEIVTAATSVTVTGSSTVGRATVSTTGGIAAPQIVVENGVSTILDSHQATDILRGGYRVVVPSRARLTLKIRCKVSTDKPCPNSTVRIDGVASVTLGVVDGDVSIQNVTGNVEASSIHGTLTIRNVGGTVEAASQTNAVNVSDVHGATIVRSTTGMIRLSSLAGGVTATNTTGEVWLSGRVSAESRYEMTTDIGQIRIDLAPESNATIEVNARPEAITVRTPGARVTSRGERRRVIVIGKGGARVSARTLSGGVDIGRRR